MLHAVERRLRDIQVAGVDQLRHMAEKEGKQQGTDMRAVHVGIGHDDDPVVAQLLEGEAVADAGAEGGDQRLDRVETQDLVQPRLLHVQDLATQRQDGLEVAIASLLGRAAGGITLDDIDLGLAGIAFRTVRQLTRQAYPLQRALPA